MQIFFSNALNDNIAIVMTVSLFILSLISVHLFMLQALELFIKNKQRYHPMIEVKS